MDTLEWITSKGRILSATEGDDINFTFQYNMSPVGTITLLTGQLPPGIIFDPSTQTLSGTLGSISEDTEYEFTLRIQNALGIYDRAFSIFVQNVENTFTTNRDILYEGNFYQIGQYINFQIQTDSIDPVTFSFIKGDLPEGVTFTNDGRLTGIIKDISKDYVFLIRASTNPVIEKEFSLYVDTITNRPPYWTTLDGFVGYMYEGEFFNFDLSGGDFDNNGVQFSLKPGSSLPLGITLNNGIISGIPETNQVGKVQFTVLISSFEYSEEREFFVYVNTDPDNSIVIDTTSFIDNIFILNYERDEPASQRIPARQNSVWTRYELTSGTLPSGVNLDITTGEFYGVVSKTCTLGDYNFEVNVYNFDGFQETISGKIVITDNINMRDNRLSLFLTGDDRIAFYKFTNDYKIPYDRIYRPNDSNFGITKCTELPITRYTNATFQNLVDLLEDRITGRIVIDKIKQVPVQDQNGNVVCDCVVATMKSTLNTALDTALTIQNQTSSIIRNLLVENTDTSVAFYNWQSEYATFDIQQNTILVNNHDIETGDAIYFRNQQMPSPIINSRVYYAIRVDANTIRIQNRIEDANNNIYIPFDINQPNKSVVMHVQLDAIPIVYCNIGDGQAVANNIKITDKIQTTNAFIGLGESQTSFNGNIELIWLDDLFPFRSN